MSKIMQFPDSDIDLSPGCSQTSTLNLSPNVTKDFLYFNVYVKFPSSSFFVIMSPTGAYEFSFVPGESGQYQFYVTAVWDEAESDPSNIHMCDVLVGMEETFKNNAVIFPNPASDFVTITSDSEIVAFKVYYPTGQVIFKESINNNIHKLDVSQLNHGIYFLQIEFEAETILRKVVIE